MDNTLVPQLNSFCYFFKLRTGTRIVGWLGVIFGTMAFTALLIAIFGELVALHFLTTLHPKDIDVEGIELGAVLVGAILVFSAIVYLIRVLFSIILVIGSYQEKSGYYEAWITYTSVTSFLNFSLWLFLILYINGFVHQGLVILLAAIDVCKDIFSLLVVGNDYRQQKKQKTKSYSILKC